MTMDEALEGKEITRKMAFAIANDHDLLPEFIQECGKKDFYNSKDVLSWLGY